MVADLFDEDLMQTERTDEFRHDFIVAARRLQAQFSLRLVTSSCSITDTQAKSRGASLSCVACGRAGTTRAYRMWGGGGGGGPGGFNIIIMRDSVTVLP